MTKNAWYLIYEGYNEKGLITINGMSITSGLKTQKGLYNRLKNKKNYFISEAELKKALWIIPIKKDIADIMRLHSSELIYDYAKRACLKRYTVNELKQ